MSRLSKNIAYNVAGQGLSLALVFLAVRFVFRRLGADALGLIYFSQTVSLALTLALELGIYKTTIREVASHHEKRPEYIRQLIGTASFCYWTAYLVLVIVAYFAAPLLVRHWVHLEALSPVTATWVIRTLTLGTLLSLPRGLYDSLLLGLQRMGYTNALRVGFAALQQFGVVMVIVLHGSLSAVVYWVAASYFAGIAIYIMVCGRLFSFRCLLPSFHPNVIRSNWKFSTRVLAISIFGWAQSEADKVVISRLLPLGVLGFYTVAKGAATRATSLTVAINEATYPHLSELFHANDHERFLAEYRRLHDLVCFGALPLFAALPFVALPVFSYMFNSHVARMLLLPVTFLALGSYMYSTLVIPGVVSLAVGKPQIVARLMFYGLFTVLPVTIISTRFFGLSGAAFGWVVYHLLAYSYSVPRICRECLGASAAEWYAHVSRIFGLATATYGVAWLIIHIHGTLTPLWLVSAYLCATIAFLQVAYLIMNEQLRGSFRRLPGLLGLRSAAVR